MQTKSLVRVCSLVVLLVLISRSALAQTHNKPKIVALAPHIVELLFEMGAGEQIIGTSDFADFPEAAKSIPIVGNYLGVNVEQILALQPDVVIAWRSENGSAQLKQLADLGVRVIYSNPTSLNAIPAEIRTFGKLSERSEAAEAVAQHFEQSLATMKAKYAKLNAMKQQEADAGVRVFYELWPQPLTTVAKGSWNQALLSVCQVNNVFYDAIAPYPQVNIEQVIQRNVDVIIQPASQKGDGQPKFNWQAWPIIPAVKHHRILKPDADKLHRMTSRVLPELDKLCEAIYQQ
ncbi:cobalamin-binding protein [Alteromonas sp. a30]|uniref:cobalamin-binding protein n=1 Tax=Alteromonas sp. a30 TaxID=2730917 RepID=UPI0022820CC5|nr:cobalamin-binding protein [Alteromonas sp. a30]MCY7295472.1 cobalamin-binding protein [Alteromonas sp. a30]